MMKTLLRLTVTALCVFMLCGAAVAAEKATTFGLKPYDKPQKIRFGYFAGSPMGVPMYIADKEGFFKELNIEIVYETFTNGPAMMEANATWDMAIAGTGGFISGTLGYGIKVVGVTDYTENLSIFARKDRPLGKDPSNPENWKGTTWLYPHGTTVQPVLMAALKKRGLGENDIKSINMDIASALTAFSGGSGDGLGVYDTIAFSAEDRGFVRVGDAGSLGFISPCALMAHQSYLKERADLAAVVFTVFYRTWEWCKKNEANLAKAAQHFLNNSREEGLACDMSIAKRVIAWYKCPDLKQAIEIMTKTSPDDAGLYKKRPLIQAEKDALMALDFFISQKKYKAEDRDKFLDNRYVDSSIALQVQKTLQ